MTVKNTTTISFWCTRHRNYVQVVVIRSTSSNRRTG